MNNKYVAYSVLIAFLMINQQSFCMQAKLLQYVANSALLSTGAYGMSKATAVYKSYTSEDMPKGVDTWIRKIYAKNGLKNADSVPLKIGKGSYCYGGHFIALDRNKVDSLNWRLALGNNSENEFALHEKLALHELKHLKCGDVGKGILVFGSTTSLLLQLSSSFPVLALKLGMIMGINLTYRRYQEAEAERFAYMNISSLDKLEIIKQDIARQAKNFEWDLRYCHFDVDNNWFERMIRPTISKKLYELDQKAAESDDQQERLVINLQQKKLIKLAHFAFDYQHPDTQRCVDIAQECIDKRKVELVSKLEKTTTGA